MKPLERQLLAFVLQWAPYGGPFDEDTFPRFGLTASAVMRRFDRIVVCAEMRLDELNDRDADLVRRANAVTRLAPMRQYRR